MKRIIAIVLVVCSLLFVCSCNETVITPTKPYEKPEKMNQIDSGVVAENDKYTLSVDSAVGNIILTNKATGKIWSSVPYDLYSKDDVELSSYAQSHLFSSLVITSIKKTNNSSVVRFSYDEVIKKKTLYSMEIERNADRKTIVAIMGKRLTGLRGTLTTNLGYATKRSIINGRQTYVLNNVSSSLQLVTPSEWLFTQQDPIYIQVNITNAYGVMYKLDGTQVNGIEQQYAIPKLLSQ